MLARQRARDEIARAELAAVEAEVQGLADFHAQEVALAESAPERDRPRFWERCDNIHARLHITQAPSRCPARVRRSSGQLRPRANRRRRLIHATENKRAYPSH